MTDVREEPGLQGRHASEPGGLGRAAPRGRSARHRDQHRHDARPTHSGDAVHRPRVGPGSLFVAPFVVLFLALFVLPLGYAAYLSLFREQLVGGTVFAGLDNYTRALGDERLIGGVLRVALFFLVQVPIMLGLALVAALAIDSGLLRFAKMFRLGIFVPYAVPGVVATLMWGYLYGPRLRPVRPARRQAGPAAPQIPQRRTSCSPRWRTSSPGSSSDTT